MTRAVFFDRDGTLGLAPRWRYLAAADEFRWNPGALEGASCLAASGYKLFVISNQQGVGLRLVGETAVHQVSQLMQDGLMARGQRFEEFLYCFHLASEGCGCRKPQPGLINRAGLRWKLDLAASWVVGDQTSDIEAGASAGCRTAFVGAALPQATIVAPTILDVARTILSLDG